MLAIIVDLTTHAVFHIVTVVLVLYDRFGAFAYWYTPCYSRAYSAPLLLSLNATYT